MFNSFFNKKPSTLFTEFGSKSLAEAVKQGVAALGTIVLHSTTWGLILGTGIKGIVDVLFVQSSQIEKKIDKLLQQPLLNGIVFLQHALLHGEENENEIEGRSILLDNAHSNFVSAYNLAPDSLEDKTFIYTLDCLALAMNQNHTSLVKKLIPVCSQKIKEFEESTKVYEIENIDIIEQGERTRTFLYKRDYYRDAPLGFGEQKGAWKGFLIEVKKIEDTIAQNKVKAEILQNLYIIIALLANTGQAI